MHAEAPTSPAPAFEALAAALKAAADPLRLEVLRVLARDSLGVLELCQVLDMKQPALSHHLKVLAKAGLVASRREGNSIYYRRPGNGVDELLAALFARIDALLLSPATAARLEALQEQRAEQSRRFFSENAGRFRAQQDLIAELESYGPACAELIDGVEGPRELCIEVGPGEGGFLPALSARFRQVVAVDNAAEMLEKARATSAAAGLGNVRFVHGDVASPELSALSADCAVVNMVLHHVPSPAELVARAARQLRPGGALLVTDLCRHDQAWAREACGDMWLGFEPEDLTLWAEDAGLRESTGVYLAQRNGFRIQVRMFVRPGD